MKQILNKFNFKNHQKGITLIELLVVIAIITILTGIILFDYKGFRSTISTENLANDVALSIRKAQGQAIGVKGVGDNFNYKQGIHFSTNTPKSFVLFNDIGQNTGDLKYSSSTTTCEDECKERLTIDSRANISGFYLGDDPNTKVEGELSILFSRPNPDAMFCYYSENSACQSDFSFVKIEVSNGLEVGKEVVRFVTVWNTGQISVSKD